MVSHAVETAAVSTFSPEAAPELPPALSAEPALLPSAAVWVGAAPLSAAAWLPESEAFPPQAVRPKAIAPARNIAVIFVHLRFLIFCTKPQAKMPAFSFKAQTQRAKDVCLHFFLSSFFFHPVHICNFRYKTLRFCVNGLYFNFRVQGISDSVTEEVNA